MIFDFFAIFVNCKHHNKIMDRKIVIIPTYNEKENIEKIIRAVFSLDGEYHILVIESMTSIFITFCAIICNTFIMSF